MKLLPESNGGHAHGKRAYTGYAPSIERISVEPRPQPKTVECKECGGRGWCGPRANLYTPPPTCLGCMGSGRIVIPAQPCGECHLQEGEACDICGWSAKAEEDAAMEQLAKPLDVR